jgi:transposase InsO family protein
MRVHANAKLGPAGRLALVLLIEGGCSLRAAAAENSVSVATAHRWWHRWLDASAAARASGAWLEDRSSRPRRQPRLVADDLAARICAVRNATGWGPRLVAGATGQPHQTVWKVLRRHGLSRRPPARRDAPNRYECTRVGYDYAHAVIDDHTRLAYVELHDDEKAATVTAFVERALAFFAAYGITARRLMTDNAFAYTKNRSLRELLAAQGIRHLTTRPYRPRTNGKIERFHQTMGREWAHGRSYPSSAHRASLLEDWLELYNHRRPHSSIGNRPPISRVHNV